MSASMYWRPVFPEPSGEHVDHAVHWKIAPHFFDHDGSLSGTAVATEGDIPYLNGLRDGLNDEEQKKQVQVLIDAIRQYGQIELEISR